MEHYDETNRHCVECLGSVLQNYFKKMVLHILMHFRTFYPLWFSLVSRCKSTPYLTKWWRPEYKMVFKSQRVNFHQKVNLRVDAIFPRFKHFSGLSSETNGYLGGLKLFGLAA